MPLIDLVRKPLNFDTAPPIALKGATGNPRIDAPICFKYPPNCLIGAGSLFIKPLTVLIPLPIAAKAPMPTAATLLNAPPTLASMPCTFVRLLAICSTLGGLIPVSALCSKSSRLSSVC